MQINPSISTNPYLKSGMALYEQNSKEAKEAGALKERLQKGEISGKALTQAYLVEYSLKIESYSSGNFESQSGAFDLKKIQDILQSIDFKAIGYEGKAITDMTPDEAKALVSEEGFFGVSQTSDRLADFVLSGGGDNVDKLKAGREGIIRGFNEAEQMWGGKLPDISYQTLDKALAKIDEQISALGGNILDTKS
ncbi:MAG: hydrogenase-4 component G [Sulfuricurvum sp.]|jgi:hypothetical protein|uniref:hydrogenase-4 component G n=1 Tax=Sulfuricurvum sp. TaxID=2025608 RepID=UPI0025E7994D|nr:hydrogenase-4 component G [Sulfuricurvum sp.]MCK9374421.1 hydrogenase-4 component G [Sulfuricurvum sp.]